MTRLTDRLRFAGSLRRRYVSRPASGRASRAADAAALTPRRLRLWDSQVGRADPAQTGQDPGPAWTPAARRATRLRRRSSSRPRLGLPRRVVQTIGFTDHAIARFAQRAGLASADRANVEPLIRQLLLREGHITTERPQWARSQNHAELYAQLGDWMLFILRPDPRHAGWRTAVTVINGPQENDWTTALRRGYSTPRPPTAARGHPER